MTTPQGKRQVRYRAKRREAGLCGTNGCQEHSGEHYYCEACRADERLKLSDWRAKSKEPGYVRGR